MTTPLRALVVEDSENDALLLVRQLRNGGYDVSWERVESAEALRGALGRQSWDIVISDFQLPAFNGLEALKLVRAGNADLPFILVSGTVGEDVAVTAMKAGANDYLMKNNLTRLAPAVEREVREAGLRAEQRAFEARVREEEARYRALTEKSHDGILLLHGDGRLVYASPSTERLMGYRPQDIVGRDVFAYVHPDDLSSVQADFAKLLERPGGIMIREVRVVREDGAMPWFELTATNLLHDRSVHGVVVNYRDITERKQAEKTLRLEGAALAAAANAIIITDREGAIEWVNPAFSALTGYAFGEAVGKNPRELTKSGQHDPEFYRTLWETILAGKVWRGEIVNRKKDGTQYAEEMTITPVRDAAGAITHFIAIKQDVTERKRAYAALLMEQSLYDSLVSSIPDHIYFKDRESRFVRINASMARRFGLRDPAEAVGKTDFDMFGGEHARQAYDEEQRIMATGEPLVGVEERETWPDGRVSWVSTTKVPLRDGQGHITGLVGISRDITDRKLGEEHIREQAALLDNATDAIYVTSLDCTILYWNKAAERTYGWTSAEALNRKTTELISPEPAAVEALAAIVLKEGSWSGERRQITKSGGNLEMFTRLTLVRDRQGQPQSVFAINTDVTEKKQLAAQFLRAQRLESIGALASGIAHDLNNVLAPIVMAAPLLLDMATDPTARQLLKTMGSSARRGADIVKQVLTFARGIEGERVPLQPRHLLREMEKLAIETFPKGIRIESDMAADLWPVLGDATQLQQALMNLCINARDAMPDGGVLTLQAANVVLAPETVQDTRGAPPGSYVCLRVIDTGTGIPPEIQARIFEPFFTTKGVGKGTGLGLSTVQGIMRSHGGFVRVASKMGQGTTFELYLPATKAAEVGVKNRSTSPWPLVHAHGEGILVVDDEAAVREVVYQALLEIGYRVITAGGGAEALRIFRERRQEIHLVLTDMMMPEMDGPTLVAALRVLDPAVKIVGITGASDLTVMADMKTLGLSAMLAKPITIDMLLAAIRDALPATADPERAVPDGAASRPAPPG